MKITYRGMEFTMTEANGFQVFSCAATGKQVTVSKAINVRLARIAKALA